MKAVKDRKGNTLQIGAVYEFSYNGEHWIAATLARLTKCGYGAVQHRAHLDFNHIRECHAPVGEIEPPKWWDGINVDDESTWVWCAKKWNDGISTIVLAVSVSDEALCNLCDGGSYKIKELTPLSHEQCDQLDAITGRKTARVMP